VNQTQRKSTAKFLYDIAKVIAAVAVVGDMFSKEPMDTFTVSMGIVATLTVFSLAYFAERRVNDE